MLQRLIELVRPDVSPEAKLTGMAMVVGRTLDKYDTRLVKLELRQLQRGEKGEQGQRGVQGERGKDGKNGRDGHSGVDGKNGKDGKDGKHGISIIDTTIAADGHLVVKLSNGKEIDAGDLDLHSNGKGGASVVNVAHMRYPMFTVATTAPANPNTNDVWLVRP